jgi:hypothetical protein
MAEAAAAKLAVAVTAVVRGDGSASRGVKVKVVDPRTRARGAETVACGSSVAKVTVPVAAVTGS